ncbi:TMEM165/GDT1 family protein [methane-oxidizing endosymbiont of Gigantopelta aegis]|uniref:TMEM165/GDT1 family protein n=1 Tax=methane-oxidizing endosymbiont of Gigantopelta aegis TaxID=2794938 RepID=UPI0018DD39A3|nr:TMEM165/GDT1 family protein [methane-oxidizing endosymbiont of Gigantopelta aegis]
MDYLSSLFDYFNSTDFARLSATTLSSFILIVAAEMGDKSQLVCMTLASKHRGLPVILGAITAFALLNTLAVVFGAALANWIPAYLVASAVAILFALFGLFSLFGHEEDDDEEIVEKKGHGIFLTTFLMITLAEFGDKTQLAVVAFSSTANIYAVWLGATLALSLTSALGVLAGRTILQRFSMALLHKISGVIFLILAGFAAYKAWFTLPPALLQKALG